MCKDERTSVACCASVTNMHYGAWQRAGSCAFRRPFTLVLLRTVNGIRNTLTVCALPTCRARVRAIEGEHVERCAAAELPRIAAARGVTAVPHAEPHGGWQLCTKPAATALRECRTEDRSSVSLDAD